MEPEPIWTESKWQAAELEGKTVQFRIPMESGVWSGIGEFWATTKDERVSVQIVTDEQGKHWTHRIQRHWNLPQVAVDRIELHPDQSVAQFRLV